MIIVDETLPIGDLPPPFPPRNVEVKFDEDMRDYYDLKKEIGRGRFGTVYLCTCKKMGLKFAAKFVNTKRNQDRENVEREIEIMKTLSDEGAHPKLIQLYDAFDMGKEMCLVLEVVEGGELFERVIDDDFELTERACAIFIKQICQAIEFIHSKNILHLDMKPENVLCLSREGNRIKICDFGLARKYDPRKKLQVLFGTPEFVAPEVVNFEPISFGTDMWSVGVICYVLLSGLSPFLGHNYVETMTNVTHNKYDFDDEAFDDVSDDVKDFIERLLILDKSERLTPTQCYRHRWLKSLETLAPSKAPKVDQSLYNDITRCDRISPETETEEFSTSSADMIIDAKLDFKLTDTDVIAKNKNHVSEDDKRDVIIVNVKQKDDGQKTESNKNDQVSTSLADIKPVNGLTNLASLQDEKNKNLLQDKDENFNQVMPSKNKEENNNKTVGEFEKQELERTKSNLKEFVERWNSHPNSPYLIGSPKLPGVICKLAEGMYSRESFASVDVEPPSDVDMLDLENLVDSADNVNPTILRELPRTMSKSEDQIAQELEQKLESLQNQQKHVEEEMPKEVSEEKAPERTEKDSEPKMKEPIKNRDVANIQKEISGTVGGRKNLPEQVTTPVSSNKMPERELPSGGKQRPSRDVLTQPEKKDRRENELIVNSPDPCVSPVSTPGKRSRKTSRDRERDDRPPSHDSNRSTPAKARRRPSRDVPLTLSQVDRLNTLQSKKADKTSTLDLWPDMICLTKDESDSNESENDYKPITGKLALPVKMAASNQKDSVEDTTTTTSDAKQSQLRKAKSCDDRHSMSSDSKTITWILDLENAKIPFISKAESNIGNTESLGVTDDTTETAADALEGRDVKQILSSNYLVTKDSCSQLSRSPSNSSLKSNSSYDNFIIQTPWGPMRRSPSRSSLKGTDEGPIINISECLINITKPAKEGGSSLKSTPSIELDIRPSAPDSGKNSSSSEKRKKFSQKSKRIEIEEQKDEIPVNPRVTQNQEPSTEHQSYELASSTSFGKYSSSLPNNIKINTKAATFSESNPDPDLANTNQYQTAKVKKKDTQENSKWDTLTDDTKLPNVLNARVSECNNDPQRSSIPIQNSQSNQNNNFSSEQIKASSNLPPHSKNKNGKERVIPVQFEGNHKKDDLTQNKDGGGVSITIQMEKNNQKKPDSENSSNLRKNNNFKEISIPIQMEEPSDRSEEQLHSARCRLKDDEKPGKVAIPVQRETADRGREEPSFPQRTTKEKESKERPITIQIQSGDNNVYPPPTRKRSLDRPVKVNGDTNPRRASQTNGLELKSVSPPHKKEVKVENGNMNVREESALTKKNSEHCPDIPIRTSTILRKNSTTTSEQVKPTGNGLNNVKGREGNGIQIKENGVADKASKIGSLASDKSFANKSNGNIVPSSSSKSNNWIELKKSSSPLTNKDKTKETIHNGSSSNSARTSPLSLLNVDNGNTNNERRRSRSPLSLSTSMAAIPTSRNDTESNSQNDGGEYSTNSLKRKSKNGLPLVTKKAIGPMLFSAQDRISQFENKGDTTKPTTTQKSISRSKTNTSFDDSSSRSSIKSNKFNRSSLYEPISPIPAVPSPKSDLSSIAFVRNRLLHKA